MKSFIYIILVVFLFNCSDKKTINEKEFIDIYSDVLIISADPAKNDPERKKSIDSVLNIHKIDQEIFLNTVNELNKDVVQWRKIFKDVTQKMDEKRNNQIKMTNGK